MQFRVEADIERPPDAVFAFLRDIDQADRDPESVVPVLKKTSPGPYGVGSTFFEKVRILPHQYAEVRSEITRFDPPAELDYTFHWNFGPARMDGALHYHVESLGPGRTHLVQEQTLEPHGVVAILSPWIRRSFSKQLARRMAVLKQLIEGS